MRSKRSSRLSRRDLDKLKPFLEERVDRYNTPDFIVGDPISIPHRFNKLQDVEIAGLWTALLSWGLRKTIIAKATELFDLMDNAPHDFVLNSSDREQERLMQFVHRTFQPTDTAYFLYFFRNYYQDNITLETAFGKGQTVYERLSAFHEVFFDSEWAPKRTRKHVATPVRGASCKRLNMFLRWMVRRDDKGVDFGLWKSIDPSELMIPLDVHVQRVAMSLGLLERDKADWKAVEELTENLRLLDPDDPARYDFALFGMGVVEG